jgi:CRP/FNR family cyclic AMP-dependent transcriptional regulator
MDTSVGRTAPPLGQLVGDELPSGFLSALPASARERLLADAVRINVPAGALVYRDNERPRIIVVIRGLLRVFLSDVDGRQVTVRYVRSGDVAGLALVVGGPGPMSIQAMTSALVAALRVDQLRTLLATEPGVARVCAEELARQLYQVLGDLSEQAFLSVRQRIALQLLNLATPDDGPRLVVHASHEELAEAVASIREVVTRNLHRLQNDGLIVISHDGIALLDPIGLAQEIHRRGRPPTTSTRRLAVTEPRFG